jgi:ubiquinol-cytochrome c reductase cytochrome c subunit
MTFIRFPFAQLALAVGLVLSHAAAASADPSAENGQVAFVKHGCWQCHGFQGQGGADSGGRVIANTQLPFDAFKAYVRDPSGAMPPFHAEMISDSDLADIYAYLESRPKPEPAQNIPLLNNLSSK